MHSAAPTLQPGPHIAEQQHAALMRRWPEDTPEAMYRRALALQLLSRPDGCKGDSTPYSMGLGELIVNTGAVSEGHWRVTKASA